MKATEDQIQRLIGQVKTKTGLSGENFYQCRKMAHIMSEKGYFISAHTLGRMLGVIQPKRKTYTSTLDLIARYLGYKGWEHFNGENHIRDDLFVDNKGKIQQGLLLVMKTKHALITRNYSLLGETIERVISDHPDQKWAIRDAIGMYTRSHIKEDALFRFLAEHPVARDLYYRSFVDEDNHLGYFSYFLERHFLKEVAYEGDVIFGSSFITSKIMYGKKRHRLKVAAKINEYDLNNILNKDPSDFHILSRYFELAILSTEKRRKIENIVDEVLSFEEYFDKHKYAIIIGRILRALYYKEMAAWATSYKPIIMCCEKILRSLKGGLNTPEEMLVQLNYFSSEMNRQKQMDIVPRRAKDIWLNTKQNDVTEFIMLSLLDPVQKNDLLKYAYTMSMQTEQYWAVPLIRHLSQSLSKY